MRGWLGTTNDWSKTAHGQYGSLDEARAAIRAALGKNCRRDETTDNCDDTVESYLVGAYTELSPDDSRQWSWELCHQVRADTTDEEIDGLVRFAEEEAHGEGFAIDAAAVRRMLSERRGELRDV